MFEKNLAELVKLASRLPQDACGESPTATSLPPTPSMRNINATTTTTAANNTHHEQDDDDDDDDDDDEVF